MCEENGKRARDHRSKETERLSEDGLELQRKSKQRDSRCLEEEKGRWVHVTQGGMQRKTELKRGVGGVPE